MKRRNIIGVTALLLFLITGTVHLFAQDADPLMAAYQKEFIFLDNEIRLLRQRITEVQQEGAVRVNSARRELQALEGELLKLSAAVDRRVDELRIIEEQGLSALDASDTLDSIITQATSRLEKYELPGFDEVKTAEVTELPDIQQTEMELDYVFGESMVLLKTLGSVRSEEGAFFLEDGSRIEGEIVKVGEIASYGISDEHAGTLAPVGGGNLQLVETSTGNIAKKLAAGEAVESLPLFLYESTDKEAITGADKSFRDTIEGGGLIGIVILVLGAIALILVILRALMLLSTSKKDDGKVNEIARLVEDKKYDDAASISTQMGGALGRVLSSTIIGIKTEPEKVEDAVSESVLNEQPKLERFRSAISVFAAVAPLLGLLGTVTGMIATFDIITIFGTGDPKLLSGGISEALITTELGLTVAIPTLLLGNLLSSWADRITSGLEVNALRMINISTGFEKSAAEA